MSGDALGLFITAGVVFSIIVGAKLTKSDNPALGLLFLPVCGGLAFMYAVGIWNVSKWVWRSVFG